MDRDSDRKTGPIDEAPSGEAAEGAFSKLGRHAVNLGSTLIQLIVSFGIGFVLAPYIVRTLGVEANGFISLMSNFVSYLSVFVLVINSMNSRFITLYIRGDDRTRATEFYTAAFVNGLTGVALLLPLVAGIAWAMGTIIVVPSHLVSEVRWLAALQLGTLLLNIAVPPWKVATFATNRLYLDSLRALQSAATRGLAIVILFVVFAPSLSFIGVATVLGALVGVLYNAVYMRRYLPWLTVRFGAFRVEASRALLLGGLWNALNVVGTLLFGVLDLLFTNVFLGATWMGVYALAKTPPAMLNQFSSSMSSLLLPSLTSSFAKGDTSGMLKQVRFGSYLTALLAGVVVAVVLVFGEEFFTLWVPGQDAEVLHRLCAVVAAGLGISSWGMPFVNAFVVCDRQRLHSLLVLVLGVVSACTVWVALSLGASVVVVASIGASFVTVKTLAVSIPLATRLLQGSLGSVALSIGSNAVVTAIFVASAVLVRTVIVPESWLGLLAASGATAVLGCCGALFVMPAWARDVLIRAARAGLKK